MIKKPITIHLSTGLEARPVAQLVQVASQFNSEIYVEIGRKKVNAKSIMGMMTLGLDAGEEISNQDSLFYNIKEHCREEDRFQGNAFNKR